MFILLSAFASKYSRTFTYFLSHLRSTSRGLNILTHFRATFIPSPAIPTGPGPWRVACPIEGERRDRENFHSPPRYIRFDFRPFTRLSPHYYFALTSLVFPPQNFGGASRSLYIRGALRWFVPVGPRIISFSKHSKINQ